MIGLSFPRLFGIVILDFPTLLLVIHHSHAHHPSSCTIPDLPHRLISPDSLPLDNLLIDDAPKPKGKNPGMGRGKASQALDRGRARGRGRGRGRGF